MPHCKWIKRSGIYGNFHNSEIIVGSLLFLRFILFNHEVVDDEVLSLHRVLAHIEFEESCHGLFLAQSDALKTHILTYEMFEFIGRYLTETLESSDFRVGSEVSNRFLSLLFVVAIYGNKVALAVSVILFLVSLDKAFLVAHTEEWRLQDVYVALLDEVGEELQEEGDHQEADVHTVDIGIGSYDDLVVAQALEALLNIE